MGFLLSNWKLVAFAVLAGLLVLAGVLLKNAYAANGALETKLAGAQKIIDQREADGRENAKAVALLAQKLNDTETKVITVTEKIYAAPVTRECAQSPAMRAASDGVRQLLAPTVQTDNRRQPAPAVSGPGVGTGQPQR